MAFVEGIGDEVVGLVVVLLIIVITSLLWSSTHVQERVPIVVQVLPANSSSDDSTTVQQTLNPPDEVASNHTAETSEPLQEEPSNSQPTEDIDDTNREHESIKIRCRFLDESSLEVNTYLSESISGLKTRHLVPHLGINTANGDNVRLIFNGRVLQVDSQTLQAAGITDNCVIHCLVHRNVTNNNDAEDISRRNNRNDNAVEITDLDLSNVCYPLLGSVLMAIWWCQVVYAHYFTLTSTLSLVSLTVLYLASAANAYLHN